MTPSLSTWTYIMDAIKALLGPFAIPDPGVGPAAFNQVHLITAPFVDSQDTTLGELTLSTNAAHPGTTPLAVAYGDQEWSIDPLSGDYIIELLPDAGLWRWESSGAGTGGYPYTVYGVAVTDQDNAELWHIQPLAEPVTITGNSQVVRVDKITMSIDPNSVNA